MIKDTVNASLVEMLIHNMCGHAILKDARSGQCLDVNSAHLNVYGLSKPADLIGHTVWDVNNFMNKMWLDNAAQVAKFDEEVLYTKQPVVRTFRVWLNARGQVWAHHMGKFPVMNNKNKVIAILGTSEDLTATLSLNELYRYYCQFYQNCKTAIIMFLKHINIFDDFHTIPTHAETMVLITKKILIYNKLVANHLKITEGTLETHINRLIGKLNGTNFGLRDVLFKLDMSA